MNIIIILLLALAVYERETVAAIAFAAVLLFCLQPSYSPPMIHAGNVPASDGQVLTSDGDGTWTMEPRRVTFTNNTWSHPQ